MQHGHLGLLHGWPLIHSFVISSAPCNEFGPATHIMPAIGWCSDGTGLAGFAALKVFNAECIDVHVSIGPLREILLSVLTGAAAGVVAVTIVTI